MGDSANADDAQDAGNPTTANRSGDVGNTVDPNDAADLGPAGNRAPEEPDRQPRPVAVRPTSGAADWWWLTRAGLSPELAGRQYHWAETPLQLAIAPTRATALRAGPTCIITVDGRRAGYIGRNPLSGNLEYFLQPWARGGTGTRAITAFLASQREGDGPRAFFVSHANPRSLAALHRAFAALGWTEGDQFHTTDGRMGWRVTVTSDRA